MVEVGQPCCPQTVCRGWLSTNCCHPLLPPCLPPTNLLAVFILVLVYR